MQHPIKLEATTYRAKTTEYAKILAYADFCIYD